MITWIVFAQAAIYLLLMPILRASGEFGYHPPVGVGLVAVIAFAIGAFVKLSNTPGTLPKLDVSLVPRPQLWMVILALSVVYDVLSLDFGLLNRRQGSEVMAEIYGTMPLLVLAIIRVYELILIPVLILYLIAKPVRRLDRLAIIVSVLTSLPFMGISDSRGRVVVIALTVMAFFPLDKVVRYVANSVSVFFALALVFASFTYFSSVRAESYYSLHDYVQVEIFQRLDGLNIVTQLREAHLMPYSGTWDVNVLAPLVSKVPFLKAAQEAKILGQTSSKQYYTQVVLKSDRLDDSNSIITDPLYYAGIPGLFVAFLLIGRACRVFDRVVETHLFYKNRWKISLAMAFCTSFITFESDLLGAILSAMQTWLIIYILLHLGCRYNVGVTPLRAATIPGRAGGMA